jgi:prepilin-type processing-associated H-X9-DG protein/prepilin-type N-terminal cleavage/methylation domain-containing protein
VLRPQRRAHAFTLIELLVVVGIIAVLLAILLPVVTAARERANRVKCGANLRSIGQAMALYTQQYGYYPGALAVHVGGGVGYAVWPVRLRALMGGDQEAFYCPSQDERCRWQRGVAASPADAATPVHGAFGYEIGERVLDVGRTYFSYGYNYFGDVSTQRMHRGLGYLVNYGPPLVPDGDTREMRELKLNRVRRPAEMIAIADSVGDGRWDVAINPLNDQTYPGATHNRGANVLFCDGHVQWYLQKDLINVELRWDNPVAWQMRRLWNNDNTASPTDP